MMPATFSVVIDDDQRAFLIYALELAQASMRGEDEEQSRIELRDMLRDAESGDVINDFTL